MSFQFTCPQGHLLEGDPAHAGMQSQCPMCGEMFIIPSPPDVAPAPGASFPGVAPADAGSSGGNMFSFNNLIPNIGPPPEEPPQAVAEPAPAAAEPVAAPVQEEADPLVHICCPNGHELETPMSMVGTDAMCPHCQVPFRLRYEDSKEYIEKKRKDRERREAAFGKKALQFAIIAAVLILLLLLGLIVFGRR
jgi:hypothetical protein